MKTKNLIWIIAFVILVLFTIQNVKADLSATDNRFFINQTGARFNDGNWTLGSCSLVDTHLECANNVPALFSVPIDRKSTRLNSSHIPLSRMPSSA